MPSSIPSAPQISQLLTYPHTHKAALLHYPKHIQKLSIKSYNLRHLSKILSRAKTVRFVDCQQSSLTKHQLTKCLTKLHTRANRTCRDILVPSKISIPLNQLRPFIGLQFVVLSREARLNKHICNLKITDLYFKPSTMSEREGKDIVFPNRNKIRNITFDVRWTVDSMSNLRRAAAKISQIATLQQVTIRIEEIDMHIYLHSFHNLAFWSRIHTLLVTIDTWESLGGALEYVNKLTSLKRFRLETGKRFAENAVKKQYYSLDVVSKLANFPALETLELLLDFRGLIQQTIDFLLNVKYPKTLIRLDIKLMLPDFDTLIQKANKSLNLTTYLTVENQSPFKEFIKSHDSLGTLKQFRTEIVTKQMLGSHSKLYRALLMHMKSLEEVDIGIYAQQAKPFLYLGIYNTLIMGEKVKRVNIHIEPSYVDFSGAELLELDNRLSGLKEIRISCPGEIFGADKVTSFFKSVAQKQIEEISLNFVQEVTDQELEKRFILLDKCSKLRKMVLRFKVANFSEVSLEKIWEVVMRKSCLEVLELELEGGEIEKSDMERMRYFVGVKERIRQVKVRSANYELIKEGNASLCSLEVVKREQNGVSKHN